jgi:hypothetical protein
MVMLAERNPHVGQLLQRCLISTDDIVEQVIRRQIPKYDFTSRLFDAGDLLSIGLIRRDIPVESYTEARGRIIETVATHGYVIIMIDVFYLEHCPEFRQQHVVHSITLKEYDPRAGEWSLIDDNPASVLCRYRYPEEIIAASLDNNTRRRVRFYSTVDFDERAPAAHARAAFSEQLTSFQDGHRLFSEIVDLITCPWLAPEKVIALLHDAFSLHMGSRICLLKYIQSAIGDTAAANTIRAIVEQDAEVQNMLLLGKVTGSVDADWMKSTCAELRTAEEQLLRELRTAVALP